MVAEMLGYLILARTAHLLCMTHSRLGDVLERFLKMFIYIVLFYWKTCAYPIDVVFEVVKEFLYTVPLALRSRLKYRVKRTLL